MKKRLLSIALCLCMVLTLLPTSALAAAPTITVTYVEGNDTSVEGDRTQKTFSIAASGFETVPTSYAAEWCNGDGMTKPEPYSAGGLVVSAVTGDGQATLTLTPNGDASVGTYHFKVVVGNVVDSNVITYTITEPVYGTLDNPATTAEQLAAALNTAQAESASYDGNVVKLLKDFTEGNVLAETIYVAPASDITLDLNGKSITGSDNGDGAGITPLNVNSTSGTVTIQNNDPANDATIEGGYGSTSSFVSGGNGITGNVTISGLGTVKIVAGNSMETAGNGVDGNVTVIGLGTVNLEGGYCMGGVGQALTGTLNAEGMSIMGGYDSADTKINAANANQHRCITLTPPPIGTSAHPATTAAQLAAALGGSSVATANDSTVTMSADISALAATIYVAPASDITLDLNGKIITGANGVSGTNGTVGTTPLRIASGTLTIQNSSMVSDGSIIGGSGVSNGSGGWAISGNVSVSGIGTVKIVGGAGGVSGKAGTAIYTGSTITAEGMSIMGGDTDSTITNKITSGSSNISYRYVTITPISSHTHCVCGGSVSAGDHTSHSANINYTAIGADFVGGSLEGSIYLDRDMTLTSSLTVASGKTLNLCLNGHKLRVDGGEFSVITNNGMLNLCDCGTTQNTVETYSWDEKNSVWSAPATATITGGVITGGNAPSGGSSAGGGGVNNAGTFNMYGGTIAGNRCATYGGGVHNYGIFALYGGAIQNNGARSVNGLFTYGTGGGVYNAGIAKLYGGAITQNLSGNSGAGVFAAYDATTSLYGGTEIYDNTDPSKNANLYISNRDKNYKTKLNIMGALTNVHPIGINMWTPGVFTDGTSVTNSSYADKFVSDSADYHVTADGSQLKMAEGSAPSGGSGGGSSSSTVTVPVSSDAGKASVSATVSGGTASVSVTDKQLETVIDSAKQTGTVSVDVSGIKNANAAKIPAKVVKATAESDTATGLQVSLPTGAVKLDSAAVDAVNGGKDVTISVENVKTADLTATQKKTLGDKLDSAVVVDVNVLMNGVKQTNFNGGKVTVSMPYTSKAGEDTSKLTVWYIKDDGSIENVGGYYDAANKCFVFTTPHLSQYVLVSESNSFADVSEHDWFYHAVMKAVGSGWFAGTSDTAFSPNTPTTRGMIVTVLHRMDGEPAVTAASVFADVASGAYCFNGVAWAQANGIVSGYGNGKFGPQSNITREQMAAILYRYAAFKGCDVTAAASLDAFTDAASVSGYAVAPMKWAVANGLIGGKGNGILDPKGEATRAQVAAILTRFDETFAK